LKRTPSLRGALVESVADAAMHYAQSTGGTPEQQLELSWPGLEVVDSIQFALVERMAGYDNVRNAKARAAVRDNRGSGRLWPPMRAIVYRSSNFYRR
jgi:hypothetical protein